MTATPSTRNVGYLIAVCLSLAIGTVLRSKPACAQEYPAGNIRFIVNVAAGGVTDTLARIVGQGLTEKWGKPVIVENRVGGNSAVAAQAVVRAPADGLTLFVTADAPFTATPFMVKELNFRLADFTPIVVICRPVPVFAVNASLGIKSTQDFIALARAKNAPLSYGSQGVGTYGHLGMEDFKRRADINLVHVPYRGGAPALEGLVRGDVAALITNYANIAPFEESGKVGIIAAAGEQRTDLRPNLPTIAQSGVPGFSVSTWFGIFGPANMEPNLVGKIRNGVNAVLSTEKSAEHLKNNSCERVNATPQQFHDLSRRNRRLVGRVDNHRHDPTYDSFHAGQGAAGFLPRETRRLRDNKYSRQQGGARWLEPESRRRRRRRRYRRARAGQPDRRGPLRAPVHSSPGQHRHRAGVVRHRLRPVAA
jgi:tripartite-type tricarboxylate transporter receptor subunit TctC